MTTPRTRNERAASAERPPTESVPRSRAAGIPHLAAWRNAVFTVFLLSGLLLSTWTARVPGVRDGLRLDTEAIGLIILGMSVGAILGLMAAPPLLARLGARAGMVVSLTVAALGLAAVGVGTQLGSVVLVPVGLFLAGLGNGAVDVIMNVEAATVERAAGKTLMPLMHAFFSGGTVAGAAIGTALTALQVAVVWNLVAAAAAIVIGVNVAVRFLPRRSRARAAVPTISDDGPGLEHASRAESAVAPAQPNPTAGPHPPAEPAAPKASLRARVGASLRVWADPRLILIGVVMMGMAFAEGSANDWIALAVVDGHHQTNAMGAAVYAVFVIAMTAGRIAGGPIVDRIGRVAAIRITAGLGAAGLLCFILGGPLWLVVIGTALWGLGASLGFPLGMSAAADDESNAAARVSAVAMIGYCAFLAGPPLIGFLGQHFGILNALFVIFALIVASFLAAPAVRSHRARASA